MFGGTSDQYHLAPFQFPWFFEHFKRMRANGWQATQPEMGEDRKHYQFHLTEAERHMFHTTFSYLSTSDLAIQRNLAIAIYEKITAPEVALCLSEQIGQEALHSWAYQTCIEVIGLDPDEVYTLYKRVPEVKQKLDLVAKYTERLCKPTLGIREFLKGLVFFYLAFEGGMFFASFNPIFSLKRRNRMPGSVEQLEYIQRDEATHVALGTQIIRQLMREHPKALNQAMVLEIFHKALEAEEIFANYAIPDGVLGYDRASHVQYLKYILDMRLRSLDYDPYWGADNPFSWLSEVAQMKKEKNFFETHVNEYQSGGLRWDD
jgi:ribonucleoside-diphosphate reductase beta chain